MQIQKFVRLVFSLPNSQSGCHEEVDFFVRESGRRVHRQQMVQLLSSTASFLLELSGGTIARILTRIEPASRNFVEISIGGVTVLSDH